MADEPSNLPQAEELKPQNENAAAGAEAPTAAAAPKSGAKTYRRGSYRPSHKGTFIGLAVVVAILAVNAGIIAFVLKSQGKAAASNQGQVTINQDALSKLGVNRTAIGDSGIELTVNPDAKFDGKLQVGGDVSIAGQLKLNSKFVAADASLTQLEAGKTSLSDLNVNGDGTLSNLALRNGLTVTGSTKLQGATTIAQLLTVNNSANISGNLAVGGTLAIGSFQTGNITVAGHVLTSGSTPGFSPGNLGSGGTGTVGGNDAAGTVNVNAGGGGASGTLGTVSFRTHYNSTPHVVISGIGSSSCNNVYIASRTTSGFTIAGSVPAGISCSFDYVVEQ
ncbi:MAG TPA: hypothetical protein VFT49_02865 [Candidatus Saccharimonadales bacterium]|nr:hypothetical protein [Candidatus Saccharimonadales bacterium]